MGLARRELNRSPDDGAWSTETGVRIQGPGWGGRNKMRKAANRATTVHVNDICTSLVSGLSRRSAKTSREYEQEEEHDQWVALNNAQQAREEAERQQESLGRLRIYDRVVRDLEFDVIAVHA